MANENEGSNGESVDRISELPDEIRECILGYLPICDAVRTSVLSQKWRYTWTKMVRLNLYFGYMEKQMSIHMFLRLVVGVLISHVGPVHKCEMHLGWDEVNQVTEVEGDVNTWLHFLSRKDIKELTITEEWDMDTHFKLPSSIFKCLGLSHLTLNMCRLENYMAFNGFPNLVRLDLSNVFICGEMLEKVIAKCPLEMLFLKCCIYSCNGDCCPHKVTISAPNLRVLDIVCVCDELECIYLKYTPNLKVASFVMDVDCQDEHWISNCFDLLTCTPQLEVLTLGFQLYKTSDTDIIPKKLLELLENLKTLALREMDVFSADHMSFMFSIIRSSPNLQNLEIHMSNRFACGSGTPIDNDPSSAVIEHLKVEAKDIKTSIRNVTVTFRSIYLAECIRADVALIDSIIACCPALGNLVIKVSSFMEETTKLQLSRALEQFGQSSIKAKIVYSNGC